jgi:hypothetical protein
MEIAFGTVVVTISLVAAVLAFLTYLRVGALYRQIGRPSPELSPVLDNDGGSAVSSCRSRTSSAIVGLCDRAACSPRSHSRRLTTAP